MLFREAALVEEQSVFVDPSISESEISKGRQQSWAFAHPCAPEAEIAK